MLGFEFGPFESRILKCIVIPVPMTAKVVQAGPAKLLQNLQSRNMNIIQMEAGREGKTRPLAGDPD